VTTRLRREHLLVLLSLSFVTTIVSLIPTPPEDLWWHVRLGQLIVEQGSIPQTNMFAWTVPADAPYLYGAWLGQLLLYGAYQLGGVALLAVLRNLLALFLLVVVAVEARRRNESWRLAGVAVILAGFLLLTNVTVRPQMWAWMPFGLFLVVLGRYSDRRLAPIWLLALPALMVFWVNVHGSFVIGYLLLACSLVGEAVRRIRHHEGALEWRRIGWLALAGVATGVAALANPRGTGVISYVTDVASDPAVRQVISEWQPPTPSDPLFVVFYATILLFLTAFALGNRAPRPTDLLVLAVFLWLAWSAGRYVAWYGIVAMPVLAQHLTARSSPSSSPRTNLSWAPLRAVVAVLLLLPIILAQPWSPLAPPLLIRTPVAATDYLRANPGGHLFNEVGYGSYLIWALPQQPVFIDPRFNLFPFTQWADYVDISAGRQVDDLLAHYGVDRVLLSRERQPQLTATLGASPSWIREYADQEAEIWKSR